MDFQVRVGKAGLEGGDEVPAAPDVAPHCRGEVLRHGVEAGQHQQVVPGEVPAGVGEEVVLHVQPVQAVAQPAQVVAVIALRRLPLLAGGEPLQPGLGAAAHHHRHPVLLLQMGQVGGEPGKVPADGGRLPVGLPGGQVVAEDPLPVALHRVVDAVPGPVLHAVGPAGQVAEGLQPQLAGVGQPAEVALGLGLQYQVVRPALQPPGQGPAEGDLRAGEPVLAGVVDVAAGHRHRPGGLELVHLGLEAEGEVAPLVVKVVGDELVRPAVLVHNGPLPLEKLGDKMPLEGLVFRAQAAVDGAPHVGQVVPGPQGVGPVGEAHGPV